MSETASGDADPAPTHRERTLLRLQIAALGIVAWPMALGIAFRVATGDPEPGSSIGAALAFLVSTAALWGSPSRRRVLAFRRIYARFCVGAFALLLVGLRVAAFWVAG